MLTTRRGRGLGGQRMTATVTKTKRTTGRFALFQGLLPIDRERLPLDLIAGATLAALAIPEVMGYAKIAGMPVVTGLYTIVLPIIAFAILGSSRHLVVGADSATAAILATGLSRRRRRRMARIRRMASARGR